MKLPPASVIGFRHFMELALSRAQRSSLHVVKRFPLGFRLLPPRTRVPPFSVPLTVPVYVEPPPMAVLSPDTESPDCVSRISRSEEGFVVVPLHVPVTLTAVATAIPTEPDEFW